MKMNMWSLFENVKRMRSSCHHVGVNRPLPTNQYHYNLIILFSVFYCLGGWEEEIPYDSLPADLSNLNHPYGVDNSEYNIFSPGGYRGQVGGNNKYASNFDDYYGGEMDFIPENITLGYLIARPENKGPNTPKR